MIVDKIIINGLNIYAYHGVNPEEKAEGQMFILDIECLVDLSLPSISDDVSDTVNYASIIKLVKKVFTSNKYNLIEKAAGISADAILDNFGKIKQVTVKLKKPDAPVKANFECVAVEITRDRC